MEFNLIIMFKLIYLIGIDSFSESESVIFTLKAGNKMKIIETLYQIFLGGRITSKLKSLNLHAMLSAS
jgi:hypothetical protein